MLVVAGVTRCCPLKARQGPVGTKIVALWPLKARQGPVGTKILALWPLKALKGPVGTKIVALWSADLELPGETCLTVRPTLGQ